MSWPRGMRKSQVDSQDKRREKRPANIPRWDVASRLRVIRSLEATLARHAIATATHQIQQTSRPDSCRKSARLVLCLTYPFNVAANVTT